MNANQSAPDFFDGISPEFIIEIDKSTGCFIGSAGGMPEREHTFLYHDNKYHFYFYAEQKWEGCTYDVNIVDASVRRFHGPGPQILDADVPIIRKNMARFFRERRFFDSSSARPESEIFRDLAINWKLRRYGSH